MRSPFLEGVREQRERGGGIQFLSLKCDELAGGSLVSDYDTRSPFLEGVREQRERGGG